MKENVRAAGAAGEGRPVGIFSPSCSSRVLFDHITGRWSLLVLVALSDGTMRWGELRRRLRPVTDKMLAQALRTLETDGLVLRQAYPQLPPRVEYSLTQRGQELAKLLLPVVDWAQTYATEIFGAEND